MSSWNERAKPEDATWAGVEGVRGVPLEVMVELANVLKSDAWFTLPHRADNYFIHKYAQYVHENLKPGLKAYVEYTNEAWNGIFPQAHYMKDKGQAMRLDPNRDYAGYKYYSKRSVEIFKIWERIYGNTDRLVRVMGGMTGNLRLTKIMLNYQQAYRHTDALAIAPYFYASQPDTKRLRSVDAVFKILENPNNPYSRAQTAILLRLTATLEWLSCTFNSCAAGSKRVENYSSHFQRPDSTHGLVAGELKNT